MDKTFEEPRHPIGVAAERTGLTPDVIRIWERRYGVVEPARGDTGQRVYSDADVERLRLLRRATEGGRSISQVAKLEPSALSALVAEDEAERVGPEEPDQAPSVEVEALVELARSLDGEGLESELRRSLAADGFSSFAQGVAAPLLRRLGDAWHEGRIGPAQEHLANAAVRRVLETVRGGVVGPAGPVAVVGTLSGERHETGALMAGAAATLAGWRVVYLGADLPAEEFAQAAVATEASAVCASVVYVADPQDVVSGFRRLRALLPDEVEVVAGGGGAGRLRGELEALGVTVAAGVAALRATLSTEIPRGRAG